MLKPINKKLLVFFKYNNKYRRSDIIRFISKINYSKGLGSNGDCWEWMACLSIRGYGKFTTTKNGEDINYRAHRIAYELYYGLIPNGEFICHKCDNPSCVNPKHLFAGTSRDNAIDKVNKNRQATGETHGMAKLDWDKIKKIRKLYNEDNFTLEQLGFRFDVSKQEIWRIINNKLWYDNNYVKSKYGLNVSKFNWNDVNLIRRLYKTKKYTLLQLSKRFSVNISTIHSIIQYRSWKKENV